MVIGRRRRQCHGQIGVGAVIEILHDGANESSN